MDNKDRRDPFAAARKESGVLPCRFAGEAIPLVLRYADVRAAAKDWQTFTSDRIGRVPIPDELDIRGFRQLPIELDPPQHAEYRAVVAPFFKRPTEPAYIAAVTSNVAATLDALSQREAVDIIGNFALPLQSHTLTMLMGVPQEDAEEFVGWGVHAIRENGKNSPVKAAVVQAYIERRLALSQEQPGDDIFSALHKATVGGRPLTHEEKLGFIQLTLSGGRDTVINSIASIIGYLGHHPDALEQLRARPALISNAVEEFVRWLSPLSHIARVATSETSVAGCPVPAESRIGLCWSSANRDETVFENAAEVRLDRMPNPHLGFGSGRHLCLGSAQARLILRTILAQLCARTARVEIHSAVPATACYPEFSREYGYETLIVRLVPLSTPE